MILTWHGSLFPKASAKIQKFSCVCKSLKLNGLPLSCRFNIPQLRNEITQISEEYYIDFGIKFPSLRNKLGNFVNGSEKLLYEPFELKNHFQKL